MEKENPSESNRSSFTKGFLSTRDFQFFFLGLLELFLRGLVFEITGYQCFIKLKTIKIPHRVTRYAVTHRQEMLQGKQYVLILLHP